MPKNFIPKQKPQFLGFLTEAELIPVIKSHVCEGLMTMDGQGNDYEPPKKIRTAPVVSFNSDTYELVVMDGVWLIEAWKGGSNGNLT